jgi:hypothetical protein
MHDIKIFVSIKIIKQFKGGKKNFRGSDSQKHYLKALFSKSREERAIAPLTLYEFVPSHII